MKPDGDSLSIVCECNYNASTSNREGSLHNLKYG